MNDTETKDPAIPTTTTTTTTQPSTAPATDEKPQVIDPSSTKPIGEATDNQEPEDKTDGLGRTE